MHLALIPVRVLAGRSRNNDWVAPVEFAISFAAVACGIVAGSVGFSGRPLALRLVAAAILAGFFVWHMNQQDSKDMSTRAERAGEWLGLVAGVAGVVFVCFAG